MNNRYFAGIRIMDVLHSRVATCTDVGRCHIILRELVHYNLNATFEREYEAISIRAGGSRLRDEETEC